MTAPGPAPRELLAYLPPGYAPRGRHPVVVLLNGLPLPPAAGLPGFRRVASLHIGRVGRTSLQTHYTLRHVEAHELCAEGYATQVWYDPQQRKAVPLPEQIREACGMGAAA